MCKTQCIAIFTTALWDYFFFFLIDDEIEVQNEVTAKSPTFHK